LAGPPSSLLCHIGHEAGRPWLHHRHLRANQQIALGVGTKSSTDG
jgi:hypothetical protein